MPLTPGGFTLQSVVQEYTTTHLIGAATSEIERRQLIWDTQRWMLMGAVEHLSSDATVINTR